MDKPSLSSSQVRSARGQRASLVVVSLYHSFPAYHGGSNRILNLASAYSREFDVSIYGQCLRPFVPPTSLQASEGVQELQATDPFSLGASLVTRALRVPQLLQSAAFGLSAPRWLENRVCHADVVIAEQPWQMGWIKRKAPSGSLLVYDAHNVEFDMFDEQAIRLPGIWARRALSMVRQQEQQAVSIADLVLVPSQEDMDRMQQLYACDASKIVVAPNGTRFSDLSPASADQKKIAKQALHLSDRRTAIFLGSKHPPNRVAVDRILGMAQSPECRDITFIIMGSVADYFDRRRLANVIFTGFIDDPTLHFQAADLALNPSETGGGTNLKQPEYMARGLPTVVTPFGARGCNVVDGQTAIVRDPQQFLEGMLMLLRNEPLAAAIGRNARSTAAAFDWTLIGSRVTSELVARSRAKTALSPAGIANSRACAASSPRCQDVSPHAPTLLPARSIAERSLHP